MISDSEEVILVDQSDNPVGTMEKMEAHRKGVLHRAFSIFLFNDSGEMLLQKRASAKYHTGGLWTNACCSHPRANETMQEALQRKLMQEMGITCPVKKAFSFTYRAELADGLTEHEYDHVFYGYFNEAPRPNPEEVQDWKYMPVEALEKDIAMNPERYTPWFKIVVPKMLKYAVPFENTNR